MKKQKINWEERRFWAAALILGGMCANYHHTFIPSNYWAKGAIDLAVYFLQLLANTSGSPICSDHYQRNGKAQ